MKSCLVLSVFLVALALAAAGVGFMAIQTSPAMEAKRLADVDYQKKRDAQDLADRARQAEQTARYVDAILPAVEAAAVLVIIGVPIAAGLAAWGWMKRHTRDHAELVYPTADGLLPVSRAGLLAGQYDAHSAAALTGYHAARIEAARNPAIPGSVTHYAPRYAAPRIIGSDPNAAPALAAPPEPRILPAPPFGELLRRGLLGPGKFALGWLPDAAAPAYGSFGDLYSVALLGATGSGKSTTARALISQTALNGGRLIIIDPHLHASRDSLAGDLAPLQGAFLLPPVDDDPAAVKHALETVLDLLESRKAGATGPVVLVVCDEWTSLVGRGGPRAELLTRTMRLLAVEGRKLGLHGMVAMQDATKEAVGPLRDVLSSAYVHRSRPQHARLVAPGLKADTWSLAPGQAWLDQVSAPPRLLTVPECTPADVAAVGRLLLPPPAAGPRNDSASWDPSGKVTTIHLGDEPAIRVYTPPAPSQEPMPPAAQRPDLRIVRPGEAETPAEVETGKPGADGRAQATDTAPANISVSTPANIPATLTAKAKAARLELSAEEWDALARLDRGQTPNAIAAALSGSPSGRKWTRKRDELHKLVDFVKNWPDGEVWSAADPGSAGDA